MSENSANSTNKLSFSFKKPNSNKFKPKEKLVKNSTFTDDFDDSVNDQPDKFDRQAANKIIKQAQDKFHHDRKSQLLVQQAMEQDHEIFEYDKIHDQISSTKLQEQIEEERKKQNKNSKAPKYIKNLLKTAAKRNLESERRYERRAVNERRNEDHLYAGKEKFITPSFKEKMAKLEAAENEEKRMDALDDLHNVKKQNDLSGFYRHMLNDQENTTDTLRKLTGKTKEMLEKQKQEEENKKQEAEADKNPTSDSFQPPKPVRQRHDSSSSESDNDSNANSNEVDLDSNFSGSDLEDESTPQEAKELKKKFSMPNVDINSSISGVGLAPSLSGTIALANQGFAPASTVFSKMSQRSRVTAGGAGIETEVDYDYQLFKLNHIYRKKLKPEDIEGYKREYFQRDAMRQVKGGWSKILQSM